MNFKTRSLFSAVLFCTFSSINAMAANTTIVQDPPNEVGLDIFFTLFILALLLLALWLIKNSALLNDQVNNNEPEGREWLIGHIKDMETEELEKLIKRGKAQKRDEHNGH
jgi:hypothetical protein